MIPTVIGHKSLPAAAVSGPLWQSEAYGGAPYLRVSGASYEVAVQRYIALEDTRCEVKSGKLLCGSQFSYRVWSGTSKIKVARRLKRSEAHLAPRATATTPARFQQLLALEFRESSA